MQVGTNISNVIDGNADKNKYDTEVKKILSDKQILAWILKYTTDEFKLYSIEQIINCIEGIPEVGTHIVRSGHYSETIEGINTEDAVPGEGKITYDIRFRVVAPEGEHIGMIINVEAQKNPNPGYDIVTRGIFYCARLLSSQMGNDISAKEYDKLQKVYSIWICLDVPQKIEHTITRYRMTEETLHGKSNTDSRYDLMELVMVYMGREETSDKGTRLHGLLSTVLSDRLKPAEKKNILKQKYNIATSVELEGGLANMCNLSDVIEEKTVIKTLISLVQQGLLDVDVAAMQAGMEVAAFSELLTDMNANLRNVNRSIHR